MQVWCVVEDGTCAIYDGRNMEKPLIFCNFGYCPPIAHAVAGANGSEVGPAAPSGDDTPHSFMTNGTNLGWTQMTQLFLHCIACTELDTKGNVVLVLHHFGNEYRFIVGDVQTRDEWWPVFNFNIWMQKQGLPNCFWRRRDTKYLRLPEQTA